MCQERVGKELFILSPDILQPRNDSVLSYRYSKVNMCTTGLFRLCDETI